MTVPDLMSTRLMECWLATLKAFCDNVACFGTNKSCSNSHLQECFQYSSLLACRDTVSNLFSNLFFPHTPCNFPPHYMFPANCFPNILFQQAEISHGKCSEFSDISSDTPALWAHDGTSLDVNKANGMLTSNTKGIFYDNVTCFGTNKSCSNSHLQECFQYSSLLACKGRGPRENEICVSLQFRAIDTTFLPRGLTARKWNLRFATVSGDRHHVFSETVDREKIKFAFRYSFGRSTPRFYREGWPRENEICVSLQFWAIDTTFLPRGLTARKWNLRFATVSGDGHHVFSERVAFRLTLPIPPGGIE